MPDDIVIVGSVGAPYGVRGWVHIRSFTQPPDNLLRYQPWLLRMDADWQIRQPAEVRVHGNALVARFPGISDREAAGADTGREIGVARKSLPEPDTDEYYWRDLQGLEVIDQAGRSLGKVDRLMDIGAHVVLVVGNGDETLIPFVARHVTRVDIARGTVQVDWDEPE